MLTATLQMRNRGYEYALYDGDTVVGNGSELDFGQAPAMPEPDVVVARIPFGGSEFARLAIIDDETLRCLDDLIPQSPVDLPAAIELVRHARAWWPDARMWAVFDTAFFVSLPPAEYSYAIDPAIAKDLKLRRFGYEGILHEAACRSAASHLSLPDGQPARILSICLEPRPELAGVVGGKPVMVTGGAGRLGGLPGEHSCGDIDPTIVLLMAGKLGMSVEEIRAELGRASGLMGLTGEPISLPGLFSADDDQYRLARRIFEHRLLQAAGAGIAAMGGIDAIVFSGRYQARGRELVAGLTAGLACRVTWYSFPEPVSRVMAKLPRAAQA